MEWHFARFEYRDPVANFDPTLFRQYSNGQGRWMSPDPLAGDIINPQSLNRYAYVLNNPTSFIDPLGLSCSDPNDPTPCVEGGITSITVTSPPPDPIALELYGDAYHGSGFNGTSGKYLPPASYPCAFFGFCGGSSGATPQPTEPPTKPSPMPQTSDPCTKIAGKGGTIPVGTPNGELRFEFNAQGNLIGIGVQLTGGNPATASGFSVPPQTFFGARLSGPDALTIGFNNAVQTPSSYGVSAYIQSATFSGGSFSNVNGAVAILSVPLGRTSTSSSILRNQLNGISPATSAADSLMSVFQFLSNNVGCSALFGGS